MKHFIHCPICKGALLSNIFYSYTYSQQIWKQECKNKLNHKIEIICPDVVKQYEVLTIDLLFSRSNKIISCFWSFYMQETSICVLPLQSQKIPWFEPDFKNYKLLTNKINTYLTLL